MRKSQLLDAVDDQRRALLAVVAPLPDDGWDIRCPNPAPPQGVTRIDEPVRTVRDLVAHLCVVDGLALDAHAAAPWSALRRLEMPSAWDRRRITPFTELDPSDLLAVLQRGGERIARMVETAPAALGRLPIQGPFGRQPLVALVTQRVLHEWLHEQDIRDGLARVGRPDTGREPSQAVSEALVDAVLRTLPSEVLPHAAAEDGVVRLIIDLVPGTTAGPAHDGDTRRRVWAADFARRHYGPRVVAEPDATVRLDAATLALLANGRGDRLVHPAIVVEGDQELGAMLLHAVRCPVPDMACAEGDDAEIVLDPAESSRRGSSLY